MAIGVEDHTIGRDCGNGWHWYRCLREISGGCDVKSKLISKTIGFRIGHALKRRQNESAARAIGGGAEQKADSRLIDTGVGRWCLCEHHIRVAGCVKMR